MLFERIFFKAQLFSMSLGERTDTVQTNKVVTLGFMFKYISFIQCH